MGTGMPVQESVVLEVTYPVTQGLTDSVETSHEHTAHTQEHYTLKKDENFELSIGSWYSMGLYTRGQVSWLQMVFLHVCMRHMETWQRLLPLGASVLNSGPPPSLQHLLVPALILHEPPEKLNIHVKPIDQNQLVETEIRDKLKDMNSVRVVLKAKWLCVV